MLEINDLRRRIAKLRFERASLTIIEELEAQLRILKAIYDSAGGLFAAGEDDRRLRASFTGHELGDWTFENVYAYVYDQAVALEPEGHDLATLIWHHDGPFGDASAVPTYIVSKLARAHVTVVLTGDGGDEVFAGYRRFWAAVQSEHVPRAAARLGQALFSRVPSPGHERHWLAETQRFFRATSASFDERMTIWNAIFFYDLHDLVRPDFAASLRPIDRLRYLDGERDQMDGRSLLSRLLHANFTTYLADDLLVKIDRCTMASSLEARSPFLDRQLVEYVAALPDGFKLRRRRTKTILRDAFADLLPREIAHRPKMGFGVPLGSWFRGSMRAYMRDLLLAPDARYRAMLSGSYVESLVRQHLSGGANLGPQLWSLICFERWLQMLPDWQRQRTSHSPTFTPTGLAS